MTTTASELETTESTPTLDELRVLAKRLKSAKKREKALAAERLYLYRRARDEGVSWRAIARAAGVTDVAVMRSIERAPEPEPEP